LDDWCLTSFSAQTGYIVPQEYEIYCVGPGTRQTHNKLKKALRKTQTLRAGCSKAEPKIFTTPQTPFPGTRGGQNLISLQTQFDEDQCTQFRVIVVTEPQTHIQTHRQDRLQYTPPQLRQRAV